MLLFDSSPQGTAISISRVLVLLVAISLLRLFPVCQASVETIDLSFHSFSLGGEGNPSLEYVNFKLPFLDKSQMESIAPQLASRLDMLKPDERLLTINWQRQEAFPPVAAPDKLELCLKGPWSGTPLAYYWSPRITVAIPATATGTVTEVVASSIDPQCSRFNSGSKGWMFQQAHDAGPEASFAINLVISEAQRQSRQNDNAFPVPTIFQNKGQSMQRLLSGGGGIDDDHHQNFRPGGGGLPSAEVDVEVMSGLLAEEEIRNPEGELPLATDIMIRSTDTQGRMKTCIISAAQWESLLAEQAGYESQEDFLTELDPGESDITSWLSHLDNLETLLRLSEDPELEKLLMCSHIPGMLECPLREEEERRRNCKGGADRGSARSRSYTTGFTGYDDEGIGASGSGGGGGHPTGLVCQYCGASQSSDQDLKRHLLTSHRSDMSPQQFTAVIKGGKAPSAWARELGTDLGQAQKAAQRVARGQNAQVAIDRAGILLASPVNLNIVTSNEVVHELFRRFSTADLRMNPYALLNIMSRNTAAGVISGLVDNLKKGTADRVDACEIVLSGLAAALEATGNKTLAGKLRSITSVQGLTEITLPLVERISGAALLERTDTVAEASFASVVVSDIKLDINALDALAAVTQVLPDDAEGVVEAMLLISDSGAGKHGGALRVSDLLTYAQNIGLSHKHVLFGLMKAGRFKETKPFIEQRLLDILSSTQDDSLRDSIAILSIEVLESNILKRQTQALATATMVPPVVPVETASGTGTSKEEIYLLELLGKPRNTQLPKRSSLKETPEAFALDMNIRFIKNEISTQLDTYCDYFIQMGWINRRVGRNILGIMGVSPYVIVGKLYDAVEEALHKTANFVNLVKKFNQDACTYELARRLARSWYEKRMQSK